MRRLLERAEQAAAVRQRAIVERIGEAMTTKGVRVEVERNEVRVSGRGLVKRRLADAQLRFIADVAR